MAASTAAVAAGIIGAAATEIIGTPQLAVVIIKRNINIADIRQSDIVAGQHGLAGQAITGASDLAILVGKTLLTAR